MITASLLITLILVFALFAAIYYAAGLFAPGLPQRITGIILLILFVFFALQKLGFSL